MLNSAINMPLYSFYQIISDKGPECYIGSTSRRVNRRYNDHTTTYRRGAPCCSVKKLFDLYGVDNCRVVVLEEVECATKEEARQIERRHQEEHEEHCINIRRAYITKDELREHYTTRQRIYMKTYYTKKQEQMTPEEFQAFMNQKREKAKQATRRWRERQAEAKPSSE